MFANPRSTRVSRLVSLGASTILLFALSAAPAAFAQSRVIQKWVDRVDQPVAFFAFPPVITSDSNGNVYVAGNRSSSADSDTGFIEIVKYSSTGARLWTADLQTPGFFPGANGITLDSAGNIFVVGTAFESGSPVAEFVTAKFSSSGSLDWSATYPFGEFNGPGYTSAVGIALDSHGNSYIVGWAQEDTTGPIFAVKYSPSGAAVWTKVFYDGNVDVASAMALDGSDNLFITGHISQCTDCGQTLNTVGVTLKYNSSGNELWAAYTGNSTSLPPGTSTYENNSITLDAAGNAYVAGWSNTDGSMCHPSSPKSVLCENTYFLKYMPSGQISWITHNAHSGSTAIALDHEGNIYSAGSYFTSNSSHFSATKLNPSGDLLWNKFYQHTTTGDDEASGLAVNYEGDAYLTGQSTSTDDKTGLDYVTLKFSTAGSLDWIAVYNGPGNGNDIPSGITISGGDLYVTGTSVGSNGVIGWAAIDYLQDAAVAAPSSLSFSAQRVGTTSDEKSFTLTNSDSTDDLQLHGIDVHGPFAETNDCPSSLVPLASCTIKVTFKPTATGTDTGSVDVYDQWAGSPAIISLTGTGTN